MEHKIPYFPMDIITMRSLFTCLWELWELGLPWILILFWESNSFLVPVRQFPGSRSFSEMVPGVLRTLCPLANYSFTGLFLCLWEHSESFWLFMCPSLILSVLSYFMRVLAASGLYFRRLLHSSCLWIEMFSSKEFLPLILWKQTAPKSQEVSVTYQIHQTN